MTAERTRVTNVRGEHGSIDPASLAALEWLHRMRLTSARESLADAVSDLHEVTSRLYRDLHPETDTNPTARPGDVRSVAAAAARVAEHGARLEALSEIRDAVRAAQVQWD